MDGVHILNLPNDGRMREAVTDALERASEVCIAVSFTRCSGLSLLTDGLRGFHRRGGRARVLTSTYQAITQPEALETLLRLPGIDTRLQVGPQPFHSKFWWFASEPNTTCWVGSSNLSRGGLTSNIEWNLRAPQDASVHAKGKFEVLWARDDVVPLTPEEIARYRPIYAQMARTPLAGSRPVMAPSAPNAAQVEALAGLALSRARGARRAAVVAATGIGKTWLAAFDLRASGATAALYVSHRLEHLLQAERVFARVLPPDVTRGILGGGQDGASADVVFATIQSIANRPDVLARPFDYVIVDEFHHADAASYRCIDPVIDRAFLLGLTATPERADGRDVLALCHWNVAYEIRLAEAIDRGWLLPFNYFGIADESVDFASIPWRRLDQVEDALSVEARVDLILQAARERGFDGPKRATIGFCAGVRHASYMAEAFLRRGEDAVAVTGSQAVDEREAIYRRLEDPQDTLQWLFVSDVLNEGVDIPAVNGLLFLRPTESAPLFLQQLGRGLRLTPGCEVLTVLDFVGHHRASWVTLQALHAPEGGGRRTEVADGVVIVPPAGCEIVLQPRTREILAKVKRVSNRRQVCDEAYVRLRVELGRPLMPLDLWDRRDVPALGDFRAAYGTWLAVQRRHGDAPAWLADLPDTHPAVRLLAALEVDWQAQRVTPYALVWGLAHGAAGPGDRRFFEKFPQWAVEGADPETAWATLRRKLPPEVLADREIHPDIFVAIGDALPFEVESRILYTVNKDFAERHGGTLRTPADLNLWARYRRPELVRHFGVHYDPARHNTGMLWFGNEGAIVTKLDTSDAVARHQYTNEFPDPETFSWTSQNKQNPGNEAGRRVTEHVARGLRIHLFVQAGSHSAAHYLGPVTVIRAVGDGPMTVTMRLGRPVPDEVWRELHPPSEAPVPTIRAAVVPGGLPFRRVSGAEVRPFENCVPLYPDLQAAAGGFGDSRVVGAGDASDPEGTTWVAVEGRHGPSRDLFVARVTGESMNRRIPNGAWCLWRLTPGEPRAGWPVLVELQDVRDPEHGGRFTVKQFERETTTGLDGAPVGLRVVLRPDSTDAGFQPILIDGQAAGEVRAVAELVSVLGIGDV